MKRISMFALLAALSAFGWSYAGQGVSTAKGNSCGCAVCRCPDCNGTFCSCDTCACDGCGCVMASATSTKAATPASACCAK